MIVLLMTIRNQLTIIDFSMLRKFFKNRLSGILFILKYCWFLGFLGLSVGEFIFKISLRANQKTFNLTFFPRLHFLEDFGKFFVSFEKWKRLLQNMEIFRALKNSTYFPVFGKSGVNHCLQRFFSHGMKSYSMQLKF